MKALSRGVLGLGMLAALLAGLTFVNTSPPSRAADTGRIEIDSRLIANFHIGRSETRFGSLEFVGGLEMTSTAADFGALSAFRFMQPGGNFIGVADTGFWYFGTVLRDGQQKPTGIGDFRMAAMSDRAGKVSSDKWQVDAEGLAVKDGVATVGFERDHRIAQFRIEPDAMKPAFREVDFLIPKAELRSNRGFETVAFANPSGALAGAMVIVSEKSLDRQGNIFAAIVDGPGKGVFTVKRNGEFDITDGAFLPGGDLLLLERSFSMASGVKMRLRRIDGASIARGKVADGPILFTADMAYQIDNMEGLDVWTRDDGALMVSLVSDDNHSILQRNLYLEFILHDD